MEPTNGPRGPEQSMARAPSSEKSTPHTPEAVEFAAPSPQETGPSSRESGNQNAGMTLPPVVQDVPVVTAQPVTQQLQQQIADDHTDSPNVADDIDVIEREWVNKAKVIIHQTRDDPHAQEVEVSRLQADYLKKRYGKVIKPSEG